MHGALQHRRLRHPYAALLFCAAALTLYGICIVLPSSIGSINNEAAAEAASPFALLSNKQHSCQSARFLPAGGKYMLYAPHSGFSNQVGELKNALLIAALLNRTLVLPPIFDHHAVALGSCPKSRVHEPYKLRELAWAHIIELISSGRYVAIGDVLDLSSVMPLVKLVDLRIFIMLWCGADILSACSGALCRRLARRSPAWGMIESCSAFLSRPPQVHENCVYGVSEDCRTTIWVHRATRWGNLQREQSLWALQVAAANMGSQRATDTMPKAKYGQRRYKDIVEALGKASEAGQYEVLSFGSLFSAEYKGNQLHVDIESSSDPKVKTLVEEMKFLPFTTPILNAGRQFSQERIQRPFFCAQLRLLDGQFKNHWDKTFTSLKSQLKVAREQLDLTEVLDVFVMTDLPRSNWSKTFLHDLDMDRSYRLHTVDGNDPLVQKTATEIAKGEYGLRSGYLPPDNNITNSDIQVPLNVSIHPDILLFIEEVICSCATLGFVGTSGSTLSKNILQLRLGNACAI